MNKKLFFTILSLIILLIVILVVYFALYVEQEKNKIYVLWKHHHVTNIWQDQQAKNLNVLHLDFHGDLREGLIDQHKQIIYFIPEKPESEIDPGNFLTYAVFKGLVNNIRWVHDIPGGREYDTKTVIYRSDLSEREFQSRIFNKQKRPVQYKVILYDQWSGLNRNEVLDIDWDFFAGEQLPEQDIRDKMQEFLVRDLNYVPVQTYVAYSPGFSRRSLELYEEFVNQLAKKFNAQIDHSYFEGLPDYEFTWQKQNES